ncbi:MAG: protein kinase [Acidobacteria bacterium]|nr:protein kinase [Acidobacteriota bacterium]
MTPERWNQIESLFLQALDCLPGDRSRFLDRVCEGDPQLRRELDSLLDCHSPDEPLVQIPPIAALDLSASASDRKGEHVGPYRLEGLIGHGGMGAVYLGVRDDDQYQKKVAIKLLKRGLDTDFMLGRFRQERQILANLEHPFIARLLDGGATADGLPYFVMEYVDGIAITKYCSENNLTVEERLRLFRLVCEAVQYAHQNLVVHRDIKPSNILVTREGMPKLLDFGVAKVLDPGLETSGTMTRPDQRMLTPDYASPEQVRGSQISTISDVYSLGAVLYEVLTGQGPHRFTSKSMTDLERTICEVDPERPSLAAGPKLKQQLCGDLDNIILTAMRKEPQHRYASAAEMSEDLRRQMEGLPIQAHEDHWGYRTGKFIRRNRLAVMAACLIVASLVGGIVATAIQARRAERRFDLARQMAKSVIADINGPLGRLPGTTAVRASMIQNVLRYLDGLALDSGGDPSFELEIADAYREVAGTEAHPNRQNLGQTAAALSHYQRASEIYMRHISDARTRVHALGGVIGTNIEAGDIEARMGNVASAKDRLRKVVALANEATAQDSEAVRPGTWVYLLFRLGDAEMRERNAEQGLIHFRKALDISRDWAAAERSVNARSTLRGAYSRVASAQAQAGDLLAAKNNHEAALRIVEEALRQPDATVFERSMLGSIHINLAILLGSSGAMNLGDRPLALSHFRSALDILSAIAASDENDMRARNELAGAYLSGGALLMDEQPAEATALYEKGTAISSTLSSADPSNPSYRYDVALGNLGAGEGLLRLGRYTAALPRLNDALKSMESLRSIPSEEVGAIGAAGRAHRSIGDALLSNGDLDGAQREYQKALAAAQELSQRFLLSLSFQQQVADSLEALGRYYRTASRRHPRFRSEARACFEKSLAIWKDWAGRQIGTPYTGVRQRQATTLIDSLGKR